MICPKCRGKTKVYSTRDMGKDAIRLRVCGACKKRFYTIEKEIPYIEGNDLFNSWYAEIRRKKKDADKS